VIAMKIKMLKTAAGPSGVKLSGKIYDVTEREAKILAACQAAVILEPEKIEEPTRIEATLMEPEETEMMPRPAKRGKKR